MDQPSIGTGMPLSLLRQIRRLDLPATLIHPVEIAALRSLVEGGWVKAIIPEPERALDGYLQAPATITGITRIGRQMLLRFAGPGKLAISVAVAQPSDEIHTMRIDHRRVAVYVDCLAPGEFQWVATERVSAKQPWLASGASSKTYPTWAEAWRAGCAAIHDAVPDTRYGPRDSDTLWYL